MKFEECSTKVHDKIIVLRDGRRGASKVRFQINNPNEIPVYKVCVDGCLMDDTVEKCDWLIYADVDPIFAYYIELKGCDIKKAASQLKTTLCKTSEQLPKHKKKCFAVTSRVPRSGTEIQIIKRIFRAQTGVSLEIKNMIIEINI